MSRSFLFWLLLGLWFIVGWWLCRKYLCGASASDNSSVAAVAPIGAVKDKCDATLSIEDVNGLNIASNRNIRFLKSNFNNLPNGVEVDNALQSTADYLVANPDRSLTITGKYDDDESYDGILTNLGIARATTVKNLLTTMGAPAAQIDVQGSLDTDVCYSEYIAGSGDDAGIGSGTGTGAGDATGAGSGSGGGAALLGRDTLLNGMGFNFGAKSNDDTRLAAIKDRLFGKPITLYFNKNADDLNLTQQQRQDFADLSYYLDKVSSASLSVEGHTDSDGEERYNRRLSKSRAETVRKYIVDRAGIGNNRLNSEGFGELKPIVAETSKEAKAKNRRVEVILR